MTLKEKFKERLYNQSRDDSECLRVRFENIDKVIDSQEVIAEEFAIGFAEWLRKYYHSFGDGWMHFELLQSRKYSTEQLLEIYKRNQKL